jgi:hypothetical protein
MQKFIRKTIFILITVLAVMILCQIILFYKIENISTSAHDNFEMTTNVNSDLILLGSSRCRSHLDPHFFEDEFGLKTTNLGIEGHNELSMSYARLLDYLKCNEPPEVIILSFDPFMTGGDVGMASSNSVNKNKFARYAFVPLNGNWKTINHFGFDIWEKYIPLYSIFKYKELSKYFYQDDITKFQKYGYANHKGSWDTIKNPINGEMRKNYSIKKEKQDVKDVLSIIKNLCDENKIKLICIQTPVHQSIYDEEQFEIPKNICQDLEIPFIDANYEFIRTDINDFYNSTHINLNGVSSMNKKLADEPILISLLK